VVGVCNVRERVHRACSTLACKRLGEPCTATEGPSRPGSSPPPFFSTFHVIMTAACSLVCGDWGLKITSVKDAEVRRRVCDRKNEAIPESSVDRLTVTLPPPAAYFRCSRDRRHHRHHRRTPRPPDTPTLPSRRKPSRQGSASSAASCAGRPSRRTSTGGSRRTTNLRTPTSS